MINEELIPMSDFLIAVFRLRAGSPTGKEISGTIEEIREFVALGKYVAIYFFEGEASIKGLDPDQLKKVQEFKKEIQQHGLVDSYISVDQLQAKLGLQLSAIVKRLESRRPGVKALVGSQPSKSPTSSVSKKKKAAAEKETRKSSRKKQSSGRSSKAVAKDSGRWVLLNTRFFEVNSVRQNKDNTLLHRGVAVKNR